MNSPGRLASVDAIPARPRLVLAASDQRCFTVRAAMPARRRRIRPAGPPPASSRARPGHWTCRPAPHGSRARSSPSGRSTVAVRGSFLSWLLAESATALPSSQTAISAGVSKTSRGLLTDRRNHRDPRISRMLRVAGDQGRQVGLAFGVRADPPPRELVALAVVDWCLQGPASRPDRRRGLPFGS